MTVSHRGRVPKEVPKQARPACPKGKESKNGKRNTHVVDMRGNELLGAKDMPRSSLEALQFLTYVSSVCDIVLINSGYTEVTRIAKASITTMECISKRIQTRGLQETIRWCKDSRNCYTRYMCSDPINIKGIPSDKEGRPKWIRPLIEVLDDTSNNNIKKHRWILTILTVSRGFRLPVKIDTDPITAPYSGVPHCGISNTEIKRALRKLFGTSESGRPRKRISTKWSGHHLSTKMGPNGLSAGTALRDSRLLSCLDKFHMETLAGSEVIDRIENTSKSILCDSNQKEYPFMEVYEAMAKGQNKYPEREAAYLRRLSGIPDKEGKTRVIAIFDYYTQGCLKPLHDEIMGLLRRIPQDCTYAQERCMDFWSRGGNKFHSLDLSNATDRLPVSLQERVLARLLDADRAESWRYLMVNTPFKQPKKTNLISYTVGQPMGAYSSWAMLALTHHVVIQLAHLRAYKESHLMFDGYKVLGDDVIIGDDKVATEYRKIMSDMGVEISPLKTHVSGDTYEFAKRWKHKGEEVTPFSFQGLDRTRDSYSLLVPFLLDQHAHGWFMADSGECEGKRDHVADALGKLLKVGKFRKEQNNILKKAHVFLELLITSKAGNFTGRVLNEVGVQYPSRRMSSADSELEERLITASKIRCHQKQLVQLEESLESHNMCMAQRFQELFPNLSSSSYEEMLISLDPMVSILTKVRDTSFMDIFTFLTADESSFTAELLESGRLLSYGQALKCGTTLSNLDTKRYQQGGVVSLLLKEIDQYLRERSVTPQPESKEAGIIQPASEHEHYDESLAETLVSPSPTLSDTLSQ